MRKIVLDESGRAWGYAEVAKETKEIKVFNTMNGDTPVNVRTRKVSAAVKYEKQLRRLGGYEIFVPCPIDGLMFRY